MRLKTEISKIHYNKNAKGILPKVLKFCSYFYTVGCELKNFLYDTGILKPKKVDAYVVSVGNLTTGGVGKTPVVAELVHLYTSKGKKVAVISRGYGGKLKGVNVISDGNEIFYNSKEAGDEPYWLAENTNAVVITSPLRFEGAKLAVEQYGVDTIILDDAFQHRKIYRDLDIVLVDCEKRFGNEILLPAGPLRENISNIKRADEIIVVSKNMVHYSAEEYAQRLLEEYKKPIAICKIEPYYAYNIKDFTDRLNAGQRVIAFSGIGQPQQFYKFLKNYDVIKTIDFDDHYNYSDKDVIELEIYKLPLITTEKDAVKCKNLNFTENVYALKLHTKIEEFN